MYYTNNDSNQSILQNNQNMFFVSKRKAIPMQQSTFYNKPPNNENLTKIDKDFNKEINKQKMAWGEPVWLFLHTICHKIKEDDFNSVRTELLQMIYNVCAILPCPDCASHALTYLNKINFNALQTKQQLIDAIYVFHNNVNQRKHFQIFPYENLNDKYSKAITINVINNFLYVIQDKSSSKKMIANELYRKRIILIVKEWLYNNIHYFDV